MMYCSRRVHVKPEQPVTLADLIKKTGAKEEDVKKN